MEHFFFRILVSVGITIIKDPNHLKKSVPYLSELIF